jgi:hypothetical protein
MLLRRAPGADLEMSPDKFDTRQYLGPLVNRLYISELCDFDERVWEVYRTHAREHGAIDPATSDYLIVRMMYMAELTSNAIRMDATWELIPPAMSLVRDRYEQTIRFSWLVRNPDQVEFHKYERFLIAKLRNLTQHVAPETVRHFSPSGRLPLWVTEPLNKEDQEYLEAWVKLDLRSMAAKRDDFPPIAENSLSNQKLEKWYNSIYRQFSSISHYDSFSIEMVKPRTIEGGSVVLGLEPHWPQLLILHTALLDVIQCYEATAVSFRQDTSIKFESLFLEWRALAGKFEEPPLPQAPG